MNAFRTSAVALATTLAFGSFAAVAAPSAIAKGPSNAPCATQQAQVDKATAKLDALKAKFAAHPTKKNKKAKKAQAQRVRHANERLNKCLAAHPAAA
ncbi:Skp family chaperone for outer membrane proteins [Marmoricola sp. OAE513]|uniref:hypothetical protein n=1 Tax=Marmoricola sp. OAE513 TaxID=2817894 RepID=UPI001AE1C4EF